MKMVSICGPTPFMGQTRTRDFSAGGLDAGYDTDFAGGVIGGDWTFDAGAGKGRVGLALNVGAGDTSRAATSTAPRTTSISGAYPSTAVGTWTTSTWLPTSAIPLPRTS